MSALYTFPFGQPLQPVRQVPQASTRIFVLGVYASAVHAKWRGPDGKTLVRALAVASEPTIFWRGDGAAEIVANIDVPPECGSLEAAPAMFNGPSGNVLDEQFLAPLGCDRQTSWLSDLLPESRLNESQQKAITRAYRPYVDQGLLPDVTIPPVPRRFADAERVDELVAEIEQSGAAYLVTLGDVPLQEFVACFETKWKRLGYFGRDVATYGQVHDLKIGRLRLGLIPLVHPRQAGRLGRSSASWGNLHQQWATSPATRSLID